MILQLKLNFEKLFYTIITDFISEDKEMVTTLQTERNDLDFTNPEYFGLLTHLRECKLQELSFTLHSCRWFYQTEIY